MVTNKIQTREIELSYEDGGKGQPVVFVHGSISDSRNWDAHREIVTAQYRMIALTQRYFGRSPWPDDGRNFSIQTHADDLAAFITALRLDRVTIVGHSYGGAVSLVMAISHPELVDRLFLYEFSPLSTFVEESVDFIRATAEYLEVLGAGKAATNRGDTEAAVEILMDGVNGVGSFQRLPHSVRSMMQQNGRTLPLLFAAPPSPSITREDLAKLNFPTSFVVGEDTRAFYKMVSKAASQYLPGSKFIEVANARHLWPHQNPAAFSRLVLDFLNDC